LEFFSWPRIVVLMVLCVFSGQAAHSYEVHPLLHEIDVAQGNYTSALTISNTTDRQLPLDISVRRLKLVNGKPFAGPNADNQLLVFPPAVLVPPAGTQVVRMQWVPDPDLEEDVSYLVVIEELPNASSQTGVQMLLAFNAVVHVLVPGSEPDVRVTDTRLTVVDGEPKLEIELFNAGNGNALGRSISLELLGGKDKHIVSASELAESVSDLFLPPKYRRSILLPVPDTLSDRQLILVNASYLGSR
jgi:fimbrial chaperone protein